MKYIAALIVGIMPLSSLAVGMQTAHATTIVVYYRAGTFPDGSPYHALLGPNQGVQRVVPDCVSPCSYSAVIYHSGWVQDTVHAYNLFWEPSGDYSDYNS